MKEHRAVKPVVMFERFCGFIPAGNARLALVYGVVDHPLLGNEDVVRTSRVLSVDNEESPTLIETLNTIYKKRQDND